MTALVAGPDLATPSLEQLFRLHHAPLLRLAIVLTGDRALADDLVQEAFLRLHRSNRWPAPGAELAYLRRTVINLSHGHHRHLRVVRRHEAPVDEDEHESADVSAELRDQRRLVVAAIRDLPTRQRECVILRYFAGLTDAEIAADLGIGLGSAKTHLRRARERLTELLETIR